MKREFSLYNLFQFNKLQTCAKIVTSSAEGYAPLTPTTLGGAVFCNLSEIIKHNFFFHFPFFQVSFRLFCQLWRIKWAEGVSWQVISDPLNPPFSLPIRAMLQTGVTNTNISMFFSLFWNFCNYSCLHSAFIHVYKSTNIWGCWKGRRSFSGSVELDFHWALDCLAPSGWIET